MPNLIRDKKLSRHERSSSGYQGALRPDFLGRTVLELFSRTCATCGGEVAVRGGGVVLDYAELDRRSSAAAQRLVAAGAGSGVPIAVRARRSPDLLIALLAIFKAGAAYLPVHPEAPAERIRDLLSLTGASAALLTGDGHGYENVAKPPFDTSECGDSPRPAPTPRDDAYLIQTSGSTGRPKVVLLRHEGLANTVLEHVERFEMTRSDNCLLFMAPSFDGSLLDIFTAWAAGATLIVPDEATVSAPDRLLDMIEAEAVTALTMTPSYLALLDPARLRRLRILVAAGEALPVRLARRLIDHMVLFNGYGPTETTINATLHRVTAGDVANDGPSVPIGRPGANKRIYVLAPDGGPLSHGAVGEICIAGAGLARHYVGDPKCTAESFVADPFVPGERMYRTGDLGVWSPEGVLRFAGRADRQVKVNGYRIDLAEIEAEIEAEPDVASARVVRHSDPEPELVAFAVCPPDATKRLAAALKTRLPSYLRPHRLIAVEHWPLTQHGKIDEQALMARVNAPLATEDAGKGAIDALRAIWEDVLDRRPIGMDDDVFALGGDSMRLIRIAHSARIRGIAVAASDIAKARTLRALAAQVPVEKGSAAPQPARLTAREIAHLPAQIESASPASMMQRMMIERHLTGHRRNGAYVGCAEWRFEDLDLDVEAFAEAVHRLRCAHPALRTSFQRSCEGRDLAIVHVPHEAGVAWIDLPDPSLADARVGELIAEACARGFDPHAGSPPLAISLMQRSSTEISLFLAFHHALLDGWSGVNLRNDLLDHYRAAKAGEAAPPPRRDDFAEFVGLEQAALRDDDNIRFWSSRLSAPAAFGALAATEDAFAGAGSGPHATIDVPIPAATVEAARARAAVATAGIKAFVLAAALAPLRRLLRLPAIALASVANGRTERMRDPVHATGLFWNIVPLIFPKGMGTPEEVQTVLDAVEPHCSFPLAAIERDILDQPLVAPLFNFVQFHNAGEGARRIREGSVQSRFHFPLTLFVSFPPDPGQSGKIRVDWDLALFGEAEAAACAEHLLFALDGSAR